jgi:uncharacterized SAM-dependent methyltransferase
MSLVETKIVFYQKQVDVAREFGVTEATVHNWIKASENGFNNLKIVVRKGKKCIINDDHNNAEMHRLKEKGRKHTSNVNQITVYADEKKLNESLGKQNVTRLINSLLTNREIPHKFSYMGDGSEIWREFYANTTKSGSKYYTSNSDSESLDKMLPAISGYLKDCTKINVIDLGCGDGRPLVNLTHSLNTIKEIKNYVAVDISQGMIDLAKENLLASIPNLMIQEEVLDLETASLQDLLYNLKKGDKDVANIIFIIGGTLGIFGEEQKQVRILQNIKDGMDPNDLLIISNAVDTVKNRTEFPAFQNGKGANELLLNLPAILGIKDYMYKVDLNYNDQLGLREYNLLLKNSLKIIFKENNTTVEFDALEKINIWKHKRDSFELIASKVDNANMGLKTIYLHDSAPTILYIVGSNI